MSLPPTSSASHRESSSISKTPVVPPPIVWEEEIAKEEKENQLRIETVNEKLKDLQSIFLHNGINICSMKPCWDKNEIRIVLDPKEMENLDFIQKIVTFTFKELPYDPYSLSMKVKFTPERDSTAPKVPCLNCTHQVFVGYPGFLTAYPSKHQGKFLEYTEQGKKPRKVTILYEDGRREGGIQKNVTYEGEWQASSALAKEGFYPKIFVAHPINKKWEDQKTRIRIVETEGILGSKILEGIQGNKTNPETTRRVLQYFSSLFAGLKYCVQEKILLKDLKWANTLVPKELGPNHPFRVMFIDGDGKIDATQSILMQNQQLTQIVRTTWSFMPPENTEGKFDFKSYSWVVAIMFLQMILRNSPYGIHCGNEEQHPCPWLYDFVKGKKFKGPNREPIEVTLPRTKKGIGQSEIQKTADYLRNLIDGQVGLDKDLSLLCFKVFMKGAVPEVQERPTIQEMKDEFHLLIEGVPTLKNLLNPKIE